MAFKPKTSQPNEAQKGPGEAEPHVDSTPAGLLHPRDYAENAPSTCNEPLNKDVPTPENALSKPVPPQGRNSETALQTQSGTAFTPDSSKVELISTAKSGGWKAVSPSKIVGGARLLSKMYDLLEAVVAPYSTRLLPAAKAHLAAQASNLLRSQAYEAAIACLTLGQEAPEKPVKEPVDQVAKLLNEANGALLQAIQLQWGCRRVTTKTGKPPYVDTVHTITGQVLAGDRQAELDADMLAADLVFLDFLDQALMPCAEADLVDAVALLLDRAETRRLALASTFQALADELAQLQVAYAKAEDIQAAGGWPADKVAIAWEKLVKMGDRMATLYAVLDDHAPDLLPAPLEEKAIKSIPNPIMVFMANCGGYVGLYARFGQAVAEQLWRLAMQWEQPGADHAATGAEFKRVLAAAQGGQAVAA
jgi:hypothetical protein